MSTKHPRPLIDVLTEPPTFGTRLKALRLKAGFQTVYAFCKAHPQFTEAHIGRLEQNKSEPLWSMVEKLAGALGVSPNEFRTP